MRSKWFWQKEVHFMKKTLCRKHKYGIISDGARLWCEPGQAEFSMDTMRCACWPSCRHTYIWIMWCDIFIKLGEISMALNAFWLPISQFQHHRTGVLTDCTLAALQSYSEQTNHTNYLQRTKCPELSTLYRTGISLSCSFRPSVASACLRGHSIVPRTSVEASKLQYCTQARELW